MNPFFLHHQNFKVATTPTNQVLGFGQVRKIGKNKSELASLVVQAPHRGKGLGTRIVNALLENQQGQVFLLTLKSQRGFYSRFGFHSLRDVKDMPLLLLAEFCVGSLVARVVANDSLECMCLDRGD